MQSRQDIPKARRWVVKVGSSLLTANGRGLDHALIAAWAEQITALKRRGADVVLVSSGAVAEGMKRLGWARRPHALFELQAAAAVGQMGLVQAYESCFKQHDVHTAQILLTHDDLAHRQRYLNARSTLRTLLKLGVVPVVNEHDTVAVGELREAGRSLLPVGVRQVEGQFSRGELVVCLGPDGREVAKGLVNYSAEESRKIAGQPSDRIEAVLGYVDEAELIHRDNLVLV